MKLFSYVVSLIVYVCIFDDILSAGLSSGEANSNSYTETIKNPDKGDYILGIRETFQNQYIKALLDIKNFDDTFKRYNYSIERVGLLKLRSIITSEPYVNDSKSNKTIAEDLEDIISKKLELLGVLGTRISPQILYPLEGIATKYWAKNTNLLTLLAVWLKTMALELAITTKENANGQCVVKTVDLSVVKACNQSIDELVKLIYSTSMNLMDLALKHCSKKEFEKIKNIRDNLFVNSKSMKNEHIVNSKLERYKQTSDLKLINKKEIERALKYLKKCRIIKKDNEHPISQMFYMANNDSIKLNSKIDFLSNDINGQRKIDKTSKSLLDTFYQKVQTMNLVFEDIEILGLNQLLKLMSEDGTIDEKFIKNIEGSNRQKTILKVYKNITLDMLISMPYIINKIIFNPLLEKGDNKDRVIAVIGGVCALALETVETLSEKFKKESEVFTLLYRENDAYKNVILNSIFEAIKELKNASDSIKSRHAKFIESLMKLSMSEKSNLQKSIGESLNSEVTEDNNILDKSEEKIINNLTSKIKDFEDVLGVGKVMGKVKGKKVINNFIKSAIK